MYKRTIVATLVVALLSALLSSTSASIAEIMNTSWYGSDGKHGFPKDGTVGNNMAGGGKLNPGAFTAAHKTLPFGTSLRLTNPGNGRTACVVVTDRGPYIAGRKLDVTYAVAVHLGFVPQGTAKLEAKKVPHC